MTEIMEEIDEDIKTSVINMLKNLKQDIYEMKWEIDDTKKSRKNYGAENIASQIKTSLDTLIGILDNAKEKYQLTWKHSNRKYIKWYSNNNFFKYWKYK